MCLPCPGSAQEQCSHKVRKLPLKYHLNSTLLEQKMAMTPSTRAMWLPEEGKLTAGAASVACNGGHVFTWTRKM